MNFRDCVIACIAQGDVVQSFNRLHQTEIQPELLAQLETTDDGQLSLNDLDEGQQELLACFILFVHHHVWRKIKFAEARVARPHDEHTLAVDLSRLRQVTGVDPDALRS